MRRAIRRFILTIGIATAIGYILGLVTAPSSGKYIRDNFKQFGQKGKDEAERALRSVNAELADALSEAMKRGGHLNGTARTDLDSLMVTARSARDKARTVIEAVQSGDTEDEDLQLAVNKARSALEHLREYLKK